MALLSQAKKSECGMAHNTLVDLIFLTTVSIRNLTLLPCIEVAYILFWHRKRNKLTHENIYWGSMLPTKTMYPFYQWNIAFILYIFGMKFLFLKLFWALECLGPILFSRILYIPEKGRSTIVAKLSQTILGRFFLIIL